MKFKHYLLCLQILIILTIPDVSPPLCETILEKKHFPFLSSFSFLLDHDDQKGILDDCKQRICNQSMEDCIRTVKKIETACEQSKEEKGKKVMKDCRDKLEDISFNLSYNCIKCVQSAYDIIIQIKDKSNKSPFKKAVCEFYKDGRIDKCTFFPDMDEIQNKRNIEKIQILKSKEWLDPEKKQYHLRVTEDNKIVIKHIEKENK